MAAVGGSFVKSHLVSVQDGAVTIEFRRVIESPKINAIEVIPHVGGTPGLTLPPTLAPTVHPPFAARYNIGGFRVVDSEGTVWDEDPIDPRWFSSYVRGWPTYGISARYCVNEQMCSERYRWASSGALFYEIPVDEPGTYEISLYFSEILYVVTFA